MTIAFTTLLLTAGILVVVGIRGRFAAPALLRRTVCGLTLVVVLVVTPRTFENSGAAAGYLLAVPVLLIIAIVLADMSQHRVRLVTTVAAVVMLAWALLLALGIGLAFLPSALLLLTSAGLEARHTPRNAPVKHQPK